MASDFEKVVDLIHTTLADPTVDKGYFQVAIEENAPLRRIVWVPREFGSQGAKYVNPRKDLAGKIAKVLYTETWTVEAHITAESFEAMELLRRQLLTVMHKLFGTDSVPLGGIWTTQDEPIAGVMWAAAEKCVMRFSWQFNITEVTEPVTIKHIETTPALAAAEGGDPTPEPPFVMNAPP